MRKEVTKLKRGKMVRAWYDDVNDLRRTAEASEQFKAAPLADGEWARGTYKDFINKCSAGNTEQVSHANKLAERLENSEILGNTFEMVHNNLRGVLDVGAWSAGLPDSLYGPQLGETDRAPIKIYIDMWISASCSTSSIVNRGVAALALVQALSMHRPAMLDIVLANHHSPSNTDCIQIVPAPTAPMDLSRACFMISDPVFVRAGMMRMLYHYTEDMRSCGIPMLSKGRDWQCNDMFEQLAQEAGVRDYIALPMMYDNGIWDNKETVFAWLQQHVKKSEQQAMGLVA